MYSVPESFLEIEVRNPQTHGEGPPLLLRPRSQPYGVHTVLDFFIVWDKADGSVCCDFVN